VDPNGRDIFDLERQLSGLEESSSTLNPARFTLLVDNGYVSTDESCRLLVNVALTSISVVLLEKRERCGYRAW
jgi:hypothetical protein